MIKATAKGGRPTTQGRGGRVADHRGAGQYGQFGPWEKNDMGLCIPGLCFFFLLMRQIKLTVSKEGRSLLNLGFH